MTLPANPGSISMAQVNTELGLSATALITLNDAAVRNLFGKPSGGISMSDGWGKSSNGPVLPFITTGTSNSIGSTGTNAYIYINANGSISTYGADGVYGVQARWYLATPPTMYVRAQRTSGVATTGSIVPGSGAYGAWVSVASNPNVIISASSGQVKMVNLLFQISTAASDATIVATSAYSLSMFSDMS